MKNTRLGPLLFLMLLAVTPRSGSATPIPLDPITTVQAVVGVTKALREAIDWFEKKIIDGYGVDEAITKLENQIDKLPIEVGQMHQKVLEGLYRSRARVVRTRTYLEEFAIYLKSQCEGMIAMYNRKDVDVSSRLVQYSLKRFVNLASNVKVLLKAASQEYKETQDELSKTRSILKSFHFKLDIQGQSDAKGHKDKMEDMKKTCMWVTIFTLHWGAAICYPIINSRIKNLQNLEHELSTKIDLVQETIDKLCIQNVVISKYIEGEINLVKKWEIKLVQSLSDHIEITPEDIEFGLPLIRSNLTDLRDACIKYLNHKLPEVLQALIKE